MDKPVSLKKLLSGKPISKPKIRKVQKQLSKANAISKEEIPIEKGISSHPFLPENISTETNGLTNKNNESYIIDLEESSTEDIIEDPNNVLASSSPLKPSKIEPTILNNSPQKSVHNILMNRHRKRKMDDIKRNIISIDDDPDTYDNSDSIKSPARLLPTANMKKTTLKGLFTNFKKPKGSADSRVSTKESTASLSQSIIRTKLSRKNEISKLKEIPCPWPLVQLVKPLQSNSDVGSAEPIDIKLLKKDTSKYYNSNYNFTKEEYGTLLQNHEVLKPSKESLSFTSPLSKSPHIWTTLFAPTCMDEILLSQSVKENISSWIMKAFQRLKKPTTRRRLTDVNRKEEIDEFANFIVHDDFDDTNTENTQSDEIEDFVPLLILHGEAVGKNTLFKVLMDSLDGKIFEVNSSSNRGKKEILETLSDFATTHHVKAQGSNGIILINDVDVIFKAHDRHFWQAITKLLAISRRPVVLLCRDLEFVPSNLITIANEEESLFFAQPSSIIDLKKYIMRSCRSILLSVKEKEIDFLITQYGNDIRKILLNLQFYSNPGDPLPISNATRDENYLKFLSVKAFSEYSDVVSSSDVIESSTKYSSLISENIDFTLMSFQNRSRNNKNTSQAGPKVSTSIDDQWELDHDFMMDYSLHITDTKHVALKSHELDIAAYLSNFLGICHLLEPSSALIKKRSKLIMDRSIEYISSRQNSPFQMTRFTRSSRISRAILEEFEESSLNTRNNRIESIRLDFLNSSKSVIHSELTSFILEIAKDENFKRKYNTNIIKEAHLQDPTKAEYEITFALIQKNLLKNFYFHSNAQTVIDSWKETL
ncbi:hypothetical protein TBLA_0D01900 [Henningerozyma blattae CBS 6284]|uniref:ATPase AAA-type core domain-containing protein n=1 Tax=Henningerozyma blattae (strain ATCC 34711 / CBS 6284 / DSM 70876 / NBRC 10599 / NRRL Y-10934 / UCD 77-7) TaxID=1071380 RepID=I2H2U5_HENB6|nr:hypothetical protein TBLA_0D01900 [Tetrapisispora blattae CBS 6284]CCH60697.1 hypothetical protein TBLA_0D01900 [Tetrapisispora blattae CBS 6284]